MDYTFKNSVSDKACTILLADYHLALQSAEKEEVIPYANITGIRLTKSNKLSYKIYLYPDNQKPILVTNLYCLSSREVENRSRQYVTFVRVLHLHLIEKSAAVFTTGLSLNRLIGWGVGASILALLISFTIHYFIPDLLNPFIMLVIFSSAMSVVAVAINRNRIPKYYQPTDIPLEFLP